MAKNSASGNGHRRSAVRDHSEVKSPASGKSEKRASKTGQFANKKRSSAASKGVRLDILFPTEPSTIGHEKIDRAIALVASRRK